MRLADTTDASGPDVGADRQVEDAFFAAARSGDFDALVALLDPEIDLQAESAGTVDLVRGAEAVAKRALMFARPDAQLHPARIGDAGGVVVTVDGRPASMMAFIVVSGRVRAIHAVTTLLARRESSRHGSDEPRTNRATRADLTWPGPSSTPAGASTPPTACCQPSTAAARRYRWSKPWHLPGGRCQPLAPGYCS